MYKGNAYEYVERLSEYLSEHYSVAVRLSPNKYGYMDGERPYDYCIIMTIKGFNLLRGGFNDNEEFEEQVLKKVNNTLKDYSII